MKNLNRALRMALRYKWSLVTSIVCSALVAAMWGANLGAVYPFVEVVLNNKSLHDWVEERIETSEQRIEDSQSALDALEAAPAPPRSESDFRTAERLRLQSNITTEQAKVDATLRFKPWVDRYAPRDPYMTLVWLLALMFLGTIVRGLALMGNMVSVARVGQRTILDIQNLVFANVLRMDTRELGVKGTGDLIGRIRGETNAIGNAITTLFGKTIREPMKMLVCLGGAALVNWRLLVFSMLVCPIGAFLMIKLARLTKKANKRAMEESARLLNRLYQAITYQRIVKAFTMESREKSRFKTVARDVYKRAMRIAFYSAAARMNNELLGVAMISVSVLVGGYLVLTGQVTLFGIPMAGQPMEVGSVILFFAFLVGIADPLRKMGDVYNKLQSGVVASDRVFPLIDQSPAIQSPEHPHPMPEGAPSIWFRDVQFGYEPGRPVLNGTSFEIPAGSSLAIVGHNGCGKSTLINLIPRFFDVESGAIEIDGVDLRQFDVTELREKIGYVTQQTMLFAETIGRNIGYGNPRATREEIERAARKAHAWEFISELDQGLDAEIGEHGDKLSGGQRQRLSLARAILKDPKILLLDEATSQIDPESEQLIHQTLSEFIHGRTTVVITHRLSTLDLVDRILVMREGRAVDCGTHEQLLARCPDYRRLRQIDLEGAA